MAGQDRGQHFHCNRRGNALMIAAFAIILLVLVAGAGVDLGRQQLLHARMQQASDAAALAAGTAPAGANVKDWADRYFALNFLTPYMGFTPTQPTVVIGNTITVSTNGTTDTSFMKVGAIKRMAAEGSSEVTPGNSTQTQKYHLVLVMDNSYSMSQADVGSANSRDADANTISQQTQECPNDWTSADYCMNYGQAVTFCGRNDNNGTHCGPYYYPPPNENGTIHATRVNALRYAATVISGELLTDNTAGSDVATITWTDKLVGSQSFSTNLTNVQTFIDQMHAVWLGATDSKMGLNEATNLLNSVYSDCGKTAVCAVVMITDGMNTAAGTLRYTGQAPTGYRDEYNCDGMDYCAEANTLSLPVCSLMQQNHALVYTIAFGSDVLSGSHADEVKAFLSGCASPDPNGGSNEGEYFFIAPDAQTLEDAFKSIIINLKKVRIIQ